MLSAWPAPADPYGSPHEGALSATADVGELLRERNSDEGRVHVDLPGDGASVFFRCRAGRAGEGRVFLRRDDDVATQVGVRCVLPAPPTLRRAPRLALDVSGCEARRSYDGGRCVVRATLTLVDAMGEVPVADHAVTFAAAVTTASGTPLSDGVLVREGEPPGQEASAPTGAFGEAEVLLLPPALYEAFQVKLSAFALVDEAEAQAESHTVTFDFESAASLTASAAPAELGPGDRSTLTLYAQRFDGEPAAFTRVTVSIVPSALDVSFEGATLSTVAGGLAATTDAAGLAVFAVIAPDVVEEITTFSVRLSTPAWPGSDEVLWDEVLLSAFPEAP